ncbi:MAG TPA: helix-turn-helix domain-containing protein [Stellaceae bacterium]|nr:helix-turn-helix domain-containing protein [Stellaceae bacterium]
MTRIKLLAETEKTVTLRRIDFQALLQAAEDNADLAAVERHRAEEKRLGWDVAKRNYLTRKEAERILEGENSIRVWREKRGMTQRALADATQVAVSYLAEIEGGKKPGSREALQRTAQILEVPMESLGESSAPSLRPVTRAEKAAARLVRLAEETEDRDRLAEEARVIVREWREIAAREGLRHQVKAAIGATESLVTDSYRYWIELADDHVADPGAAKRMRRIAAALDAALDALKTKYDAR